MTFTVVQVDQERSADVFDSAVHVHELMFCIPSPQLCLRNRVTYIHDVNIHMTQRNILSLTGVGGGGGGVSIQVKTLQTDIYNASLTVNRKANSNAMLILVIEHQYYMCVTASVYPSRV